MTDLMKSFQAVCLSRRPEEINRLRVQATAMGEYDLVSALNQLEGQVEDHTPHIIHEEKPANFASAPPEEARKVPSHVVNEEFDSDDIPW